jgi:hypothetical protein
MKSLSFRAWVRYVVYPIFCKFESLIDLTKALQVVTKDSAKLIGYVQIPIHANHKVIRLLFLNIENSANFSRTWQDSRVKLIRGTSEYLASSGDG